MVCLLRALRAVQYHGLSAVRLLDVQGNLLRVAGGDVLDNTPLLDIKPYIPSFDSFPAQRIGWYDNAKGNSIVADSRFEANKGNSTSRS